MKAVVAFAVRLTLNSLALPVSLIVAFAVTGMARMETQSETASAAQAAATLPPLLLYTTLVAARTGVARSHFWEPCGAICCWADSWGECSTPASCESSVNSELGGPSPERR